MAKKVMEFVNTPVKRNSHTKSIVDATDENYLNKISTGRILWHVIKRHRFALAMVWAVVATIGYLFPPVLDILGALVS